MTDLHSKLELYAHESLEVIVDEMRDVSNKPELRSKNAFGILAAAGYGAVNKHQTVQGPELPEGLADQVAETTRELQETEFAYKFVEPELSAVEEEL